MIGQPVDADQLDQDLQAFFNGCERVAKLCSDPAQQKALLDSIAQVKQACFLLTTPSVLIQVARATTSKHDPNQWISFPSLMWSCAFCRVGADPRGLQQGRGAVQSEPV